MRLYAACTTLLLLSSAPAQQPVPTTPYTDPATGVSLRYPSVWKPATGAANYLPAQIFSGDTKPRFVVQFGGAGNVYEHTDLSSLAFSYGPVAARTAEACRALVTLNGAATAPPSVVVIHGVKYFHATGGDAAMSHDLSASVYTTFRDGTCLAFEADFFSMAPGVVEGSRPLTGNETKALNRHLEGIMQTVTIGPRPRP